MDFNFSLFEPKKIRNPKNVEPTVDITPSFSVRYTAKGAYIGAMKFFKFLKTQPAELIRVAPVKSGNFIGLKLYFS